MLLTVALPPALVLGGDTRVRLLHAAPGEMLAPGGRLLDFSVDLSAGAAHDCPPISHYRLVVREKGWVRRLYVDLGEPIVAGAPLALLSTDPDEPDAGMPGRAARVTVASIVFHAAGWGGPA